MREPRFPPNNVTIVGVSMRTERFATEIHYDVVALTDEPIFEGNENEFFVWSEVVPFGRSDEFQPGGPRFVQAAREQERIAGILMQRIKSRT